jgi:PAS domain S-box-containing protein
LAVAAAAGTLLAARALENPVQGVLLTIPVLVTVLVALGLGAGAGLVASLLMGVGLSLLEVAGGSFALAGRREVARLVAYLVSTLGVVVVAAMLGRTRGKLSQAKAQTEQALCDLQAHAERLSRLTENSPEAIARFDRELRHTFVNEYGARVYGRSRSEVLGRTNAELGLPADKVAFWNEHFGQVFATGRQQTVDFDFDSPTFGHQHFSSLFVPEADALGHVGSVLAITRDVTELRRAEQTLLRERDFIAAVLDTTASVVAVFDGDGRIVRCNRAAEAATGYTSRELLGMSWADLVPAEEISPVQQTWDELALDGSPNQRENHWRAKDGSLRLFAWSNTAVTGEAGRPSFVVATGIDVTERARAEAELRRSEEHRRLALEGAALGTWDYDLVHGAVYFDERFKAIHGVVEGDQMPCPEIVSSLVDAEDRARVDAEVRQAIASADPFESEYRPHPRGVVRWAHARGRVIFAGTGPARRAVRFVGTVADTSSAREADEALRESEARFRQLADSMPQVIWTARPDGTVDYYNERVRELSGARRLDDGSWQWEAVLHPDDAQATEEAWTCALRTGERYELAHRIRRADGQYHWYLSRGLPVLDAAGRVVRWFGTATDIDAQKQAEEALREADRRKTEFLGMLSHELRNPLAPIRNSLYVIDRVPPAGPQARRAHEVIGRQVAHMSRLVDDLLDVTRISRGKIRLQREPVDLCVIVRRAAEDHRSLFATAGLDLEIAECSGPLPAFGDPTRIAQVVGNLLANAVKFTPRGGHVRLSLNREGPGSAAIHVEDDGAGIAAGLLTQLFEPFVQAESTLDRTKGGLGLGLALVKGLVELHGGRVSVHSDGAGRGARFTVRLPLEQAPAPLTLPDAARPGPAARGSARRILVIEDNADAAETLREALELNGHEVAVANEGPEGVMKAKALRPEVVVCDIGLPGMNGYEVARAIRADPALRGTSLVALSGYAQPEDLERSREAGFFRHLAKPPDLGVLERTLDEAAAAALGERPGEARRLLSSWT